MLIVEWFFCPDRIIPDSGLTGPNNTYILLYKFCYNLIKSSWIRNNQNEGWKWNGNLYKINNVQYLPVKKVTTARGDYFVYFHC